MSLRLRLIVAFLVFSVLPLGAMTWYTYTSSVQALRDAVEHDSDMLAGELTQRMQLITAQLGERMEHLMDMDTETGLVSAPSVPVRPARSLVPDSVVASSATPARPEPASPPSPPSPPSPVPPPPLSAAAGSGESAAALEARVANRLGDVVMLLNNVELRGIAPPPSRGEAAGAEGGRRGSNGRGRGTPGRGDGQGSQGPQSRADGQVPQSRGDGPPRGFPRRPVPTPSPSATSTSGGPVTEANADARSMRPIGPMLPRGPAPAEAADGRIRIDLSEIRRDMFRQLSPTRSLMEMEPAERERIMGEINQRLLGIQQGLKLGAQAIQKEADEAKRESQTSGETSTATTAVGASSAAASTASTAAGAAAKPSAPRASSPASATGTTAVAGKSVGGAPGATTSNATDRPGAPGGSTRSTGAAAALSGNRINVQRERDGVVRQVNAEVNMDELLAMVFSKTPRDRGEVPFAIAKDGHIYAPTPEDRKRVETLGAEIANPDAAVGARRLPQWTVVTVMDPTGSGVKFGIARPMAAALRDIRRTAVRSAGLGMLFICMTLIAVVPLSNGLTRNLSRLNAGVHRIAGGDYQARVAVKGRGEIGRLAQAFNQMAEDVSRHQQAAIGQERIRRELELGRQIQHDMLPREPLRSGPVEIRGVSVAAGEVGGDFFNYFETKTAQVALLIGDVSGKGVGAALLMANIQASLRTRLMMGQELTALAAEVDRDIQDNTPGPVYATLFVGSIDPSSRTLRYVNAGHNPQYLLRRRGGLERLESSGLPVGLLAGRGYTEQQIALEPGDVMFCYTDGCVEAENRAGDMFGAEALERELLAADGRDPEQLLHHMEAVLQQFRAGREPADDATMMIARVS